MFHKQLKEENIKKIILFAFYIYQQNIRPFGPNPLLGLPAGFLAFLPSFDTLKGYNWEILFRKFWTAFLNDFFEKAFAPRLQYS